MDSYEEGYLLTFGLIDHQIFTIAPAINYWIGGSTNDKLEGVDFSFSFDNDYIKDYSGIKEV